MKKILIFIFIAIQIFSDDFVDSENLLPISKEDQIKLYFVEGDLDNAKKIIDELDKTGYEYNYYLGKYYYENKNKKEALLYFNKALSLKKESISLRFDILRIYLTDKSYNKEVKESISYLDKQSLTDDEKNILSDIKVILKNLEKFSYSQNVTAELTYDSNKNKEKDGKSEIYNLDSYSLMGSKDFVKGKLKFYGNISQKVSLSTDGSSGIDFLISGEYEDKYKNIDYSIPFYFQYSGLNEDEKKFLLGINYRKNYKEKNDFTSGVLLDYKKTNLYNGVDTSVYAGYGLKGKFNYNSNIKISQSFYNIDSYNSFNMTLSLGIDTMLNNMYYLYGKYIYEYIDSSYEYFGQKRKDMSNTLKFGYIQDIFREDLKLKVEYSYSYDDTNFKGYENSRNILTTSIKWEF